MFRLLLRILGVAEKGISSVSKGMIRMRCPIQYHSIMNAIISSNRLKIFRESKTLYPCLIVFVILLSLLLCLLRINGYTEGLSSYPIDSAFYSGQYQTSLLLAAIVTIPMALDAVLDAIILNISNVPDVVTLIARVILILSMSLPNLLLYSGDFQQSILAEGYECMNIFVNVAARGCLCMLISQVNKGPFNGMICVSTIVFYMMASHIHQAGHRHVDTSYATIFLFSVAYAHYFYLFSYWAITWIWQERKMDSDDVCMIIYFAGLFVLSAGNTTILGTLPEGAMSMSVQNYLYLVFLVIILAFPGQVSRFNLRKMIRKMEEKEAFIRYISHEIRTPLNTVFLGMSYIKGELMGIAPLVSEYVEPIIDTVNEVNNCCEVALSIVNDLLTFDKLEEGKMALEVKETEIRKYVTETIKPFDIQAREKGINISFVMDESDVEWANQHVLRVDQHKMSQVIRNLVSNAVKFTPVDGMIEVSMSRVQIHVAAARRHSFVRGSTLKHPQVASKTTYSKVLRTITTKYVDLVKSTYGVTKRSKLRPNSDFHADYLRIEVRDSGAGISEENQKRLFGQYVQFNAAKLQQGNGSGLGLWISKGITELHGGCIGAYSKGEGLGSTFFLELPFFPKVAVIGLDDLPRCRGPLTLSGRRRNFDNQGIGIGMHPKGSGFNSNISLADLISLDRKIRSRAGSSEYIYNSEISESMNISSRTMMGRGDILGSSDSLASKEDSKFDSVKSGLTLPSLNKNMKGVINFTAIFRNNGARVGCNSGETDGEDVESGRRGSGSGPYLRPRDSSTSDQRTSDPRRNSDHSGTGGTSGTVGMSLGGSGGSSATGSGGKLQSGGNGESGGIGGGFGSGGNVFGVNSGGFGSGGNWGSGGSVGSLGEPRRSVGSMSDAATRNGSVGGMGSVGGRMTRVLVVDDSVPTRKLMERVLSKKGYDVQSAEDGLECLKLIESSLKEGDEGDGGDGGDRGRVPFDVIIMDDNMPNMTGRDAARMLREKGFTGMICGVTGNTTLEEKEHFISNGANLVFPKPLDLDLFERELKGYTSAVTGTARI